MSENSRTTPGGNVGPSNNNNSNRAPNWQELKHVTINLNKVKGQYSKRLTPKKEYLQIKKALAETDLFVNTIKTNRNIQFLYIDDKVIGV